MKRIISMVLLDLSVRVKNNPWIDGNELSDIIRDAAIAAKRPDSDTESQSTEAFYPDNILNTKQPATDTEPPATQETNVTINR